MVNSDKLTFNKPPRLLLALCLILAIVASGFAGVYASSQVKGDPYIGQVLAIQGDSIRGNAIFQINCAGCHGSKADGNVGPSLWSVAQRKSDSRLIKQVISGSTPPMPKFQPAPQEMADLLSYLHSL